VTVSARADTIESLAGQESEIRNVGPEPERATVTYVSKVNVDLYSVSSQPPLMCSEMARVRGITQFTCHPHVYPRME